jgi:hypothetical protein
VNEVVPAQPVIPLEYATPPPRRRWSVIFTGDAILDAAVAAVSVAVNVALLSDAASSPRVASSLSFLGNALVLLDAMASIGWAVMLLACAIVLVIAGDRSAGLHRIYARGKLLLGMIAMSGAVLLMMADPVDADTAAFAARVMASTVFGALYAVLLLYFWRKTMRPLVKS